jgi:hypothetical protein
MLLGVRAGAVALLLVSPAIAQESGASHSAPAGTAAAAETAPATVPQPTPGDRWTYDVTDDISGKLQLTRTDMITDVSKDAITVRFDVAGTGGSGTIVYDRAWDIVRADLFKYSPNDGTGVHLPLTVGAQWKFAIDVANTRNGATFRRTGNSKVVGQENITTKAGTFDTFVVETDFTGHNVQDPTLVNQTSWRTWFAPGIDHWVKRTILARQRGHVVSKSTVELTKYNRGTPQ